MDANKLLDIKQFLGICSRSDYSIVNKDVHELIVDLQQSQDRERALKEELEEAQFEKAQENKRNRWLCTQVKQAEDRERALQEKLDKIQETHTDNEGYVWEAPTSYAYAMACKALHEHTNKERALREALELVVNTFEKDIKQGYKTKDKEYAIDILSKALEASK